MELTEKTFDNAVCPFRKKIETVIEYDSVGRPITEETIEKFLLCDSHCTAFRIVKTDKKEFPSCKLVESSFKKFLKPQTQNNFKRSYAHSNK